LADGLCAEPQHLLKRSPAGEDGAELMGGEEQGSKAESGLDNYVVLVAGVTTTAVLAVTATVSAIAIIVSETLDLAAGAILLFLENAAFFLRVVAVAAETALEAVDFSLLLPEFLGFVAVERATIETTLDTPDVIALAAVDTMDRSLGTGFAVGFLAMAPMPAGVAIDFFLAVSPVVTMMPRSMIAAMVSGAGLTGGGGTTHERHECKRHPYPFQHCLTFR
ncbi:MAG: hypothetical protein AAFY56_23705, partial [Pseudomonadota bacterium]